MKSCSLGSAWKLEKGRVTLFIFAAGIFQGQLVMPMTALDASTPNYVLIDGTLRIDPTLVPLGSGLECSAIYGFSAKGPYDTFCANSQQALKPYPLVKGYLRNQLVDHAASNEPKFSEAARLFSTHSAMEKEIASLVKQHIGSEFVNAEQALRAPCTLASTAHD